MCDNETKNLQSCCMEWTHHKNVEIFPCILVVLYKDQILVLQKNKFLHVQNYDSKPFVYETNVVIWYVCIIYTFLIPYWFNSIYWWTLG